MMIHLTGMEISGEIPIFRSREYVRNWDSGRSALVLLAEQDKQRLERCGHNRCDENQHKQEES